MGAPAPRCAALRSIEFFENLTRGPPLNRVGIIGLRPAVLVVALDPVLSLGWTDTEGGISGCSPRVHGDHDLESELDGDVVVLGGGVACHWRCSRVASQRSQARDIAAVTWR